MTWPEVIDSAIKIGLPIVLTGLFAIVTARYTTRVAHRRELIRELSKRRQESLERIVEEFESAHLAIFEQVGLVVALIRTIQAGHGPIEVGSNSEEVLTDPISVRSLKQIYTLEARLLLLGMSSSALKLANYRAKAHEVFEGLPSLEDLSGLHSYDYDTDATEAKAAEVNNLRNEVYQEMSMIYGNVDWEPLRDKQRRQTSA